MYNIDKRDEACDIVKEGRLLAWYKLRDQGIEIDMQNINCRGDVLVINDRKRPSEDVLTQFANTPAAAAKGGKAAPEKKAPAGKDKNAAAALTEDLPVVEEEAKEVLNFSKEVKYDLVKANVEINSSEVIPNIYLLSLPLAIRFDMRYSQYCCMI
jgi:hypothetical protein